MSKIDTIYDINVPLGGIVSWSDLNQTDYKLSDKFQLCDGTVISDKSSVFYGQNTPNLQNGYFLYGNSTSGQTKTQSYIFSHGHNLSHISANYNYLAATYQTSDSLWLNLYMISSGTGTPINGYSVKYYLRIK